MSVNEMPVIAEERDETHLDGRPVIARRRTVVSGDPAFRVIQMVWFVLGLVEGLMGLRVLFKAAAANPDTGFVSFIYAVAAPLAAPFGGITPDYVTRHNVVEISTLIGMVVYLVAAFLVVKLVRITTAPRPDDPAGPRTTRTTTTY